MSTNKHDNYLVMNPGSNPGVGFNFLMRVEGIYDVPCRKIKGFTKNNEYDSIQEGGLNDYVHIRRKPISQPFTFQVERYIGTDIIDPLPNGAELTLPIILFVGGGYGNILSDTRRTYIFMGCTVMGKEYGELNAEQSALAVDTVTIAYQEMFILDGITGINMFDGFSTLF